jgi:hypothetical protein
MTCIILQDQPRAAEHPSGSGEDPSGHETEFTENPSRHEMEFTENPSVHEMEVAEYPPQVPQKWWTRKIHYVAPPLVPTNPESRPIIKLVGER